MLRLDKYLAHSGYGSRKYVKDIIRKGNVIVNGEVIRDDDYKVNEVEDEVVVYDKAVDYKKFIYIMLNKPQGYLSASFDKKAVTVLDLVKEYDYFNLFPVGRLDKDSEGLLLISNDGKLAHRLLHPSYHVYKTYLVTTDFEIKEELIQKFKDGVTLDDGYLCLPAGLEIIDSHSAKVTIKEGKFHQVKRMFEAFNITVLSLKRLTFKNLVLDENLKPGEYRLLTDEEIADLVKEN